MQRAAVDAARSLVVHRPRRRARALGVDEDEGIRARAMLGDGSQTGLEALAGAGAADDAGGAGRAIRASGHADGTSAARRRAAARIPIPTAFAMTITRVILSANTATLSTLMIGNTDSAM